MDNEKAFKNWINAKVVSTISDEIKKIYPEFNSNEFKKVSTTLSSLELKQRVLVLTQALKKFLPNDYMNALEVLNALVQTKKLKGFELWPVSEYIAQFGLDNFDDSILALYNLTPYFTSEFAIRPYIIRDTKRVLRYFKTWSKDKNFHIRRWVSEGSRPLLPWGQKLTPLIDNPALTLTLLENLKFDEELYVRKSVANHLNDISKFNPALVVATLKTWNKTSPIQHQEKINWITKHALRTLIKKGDSAALKLIGVSSAPAIELNKFKLSKKSYQIGERLEFDITLKSLSSKSQKLVIDYRLLFLKANGKPSPKVFKLKTITLEPRGKLELKKTHSLKKITTMKFYPGKQGIALQINGIVHSELKWELESI